MRTLATLTAFLFFALTSVKGYAGEYIVEAIVFSNPVEASDTSEYWNASDPRNQRAVAKLEKQLDLSQVPAEDLELIELAEVLKKLERNPDYQVLQSKSWVQAEANYADALVIDIGERNLSGTIKVYAPNLLFAEIALRYTPGDILSQADTTLPSFFLDEKRKLKLKETHYFDSPRLGVILNVRRADTAPAAE